MVPSQLRFRPLRVAAPTAIFYVFAVPNFRDVRPLRLFVVHHCPRSIPDFGPDAGGSDRQSDPLERRGTTR
jgi:hypothetical protein